jgi:aquaporin Z
MTDQVQKIGQRRESDRSALQFSDRSREWRRIFSEIWGTFLLVLAAAGGGVTAAKMGTPPSPEMAAAPGLVVMAVVYFMGTVSGAHLNPAVTFAFALRRNFPWNRVWGYVIAQFVGAFLAALLLYMMFGTVGDVGATTPQNGVTAVEACIIEAVLTAGLVNTILGTASGARNVGTNGALAIGGYIAVAAIWAGPLTGASMNPARSLAPDLLRGDFSTTWIYFAGPFVGAVVGVVFEWLLKGPPTKSGAIAAQGVVDEEANPSEHPP